jgi:hypothetical protein
MYIFTAVMCARDTMMFLRVTCPDHVVKQFPLLFCPLLLDHCGRAFELFSSFCVALYDGSVLRPMELYQMLPNKVLKAVNGRSLEAVASGAVEIRE